VDPDSSRLRVTVTDGRGRPVRDAGLARWLAAVAPARARGEVAIALATDQHIQKLNRVYRQKDVPTDVLSFAADGEIGAPAGIGRERRRSTEPGMTLSASKRRDREPLFLGDIVIATGVARRQAREAGHSYATELRVLALHGLLHLLGYDHDHPDDSGRMARAEARLRRKGRLREGLIARSRRRP
jgi:probable rRNA maturation factor